MKVRIDFVTNSSSTSFIVITSSTFTKGKFLKLMGITPKSPLRPAFETLYNTMKRNMKRIGEVCGNSNGCSGKPLESILKGFSKEVMAKVSKAKHRGQQVFLGQLSSGDNDIEEFFCCDSFELGNEELFISALQCVW